jgi:glycosyltransferase involved in cell wall biosynthesis
MAGTTVEFCGRVSDEDLLHLYAHCRALLLPGEEDFGIAPVEALASGKPVIALGKGGVLESVPAINPRAGFFYSEPGEYRLEQAVRSFERQEKEISPATLQMHAARFSPETFAREMSKILFDRGPQKAGGRVLDLKVGA